MTSNGPERKSVPAVDAGRRMAALVLLCTEEIDTGLVIGNLPISANDAARRGILTLITTQDTTDSVPSVPVPLVVVAPLANARRLGFSLQGARRVCAIDAEDDPDLLYQVRYSRPVVLTSRAGEDRALLGSATTFAAALPAADVNAVLHPHG